MDTEKNDSIGTKVFEKSFRLNHVFKNKKSKAFQLN